MASLLPPVLGGREIETGLEVVVEGGGTTEAGGSESSNVSARSGLTA